MSYFYQGTQAFDFQNGAFVNPIVAAIPGTVIKVLSYVINPLGDSNVAFMDSLSPQDLPASLLSGNLNGSNQTPIVSPSAPQGGGVSNALFITRVGNPLYLVSDLATPIPCCPCLCCAPWNFTNPPLNVSGYVVYIQTDQP